MKDNEQDQSPKQEKLVAVLGRELLITWVRLESFFRYPISLDLTSRQTCPHIHPLLSAGLPEQERGNLGPLQCLPSYITVKGMCGPLPQGSPTNHVADGDKAAS